MEAFLNIKIRLVIPTDTRRFFHHSCLSSQCEYYEKSFEHRSELQVANCLIAHVLSNSYNVSSLELGNERTALQPGSVCDAIVIVLNQVRVYHVKVYADDVVSNFWFLRSFASRHYSKFIANNTSEKIS